MNPAFPEGLGFGIERKNGVKKRLKINGFIIFCAFLLIVAFPTIFFRDEKISYFGFDQAVEIFGIVFILLGQVLRVSSRGYKSEHSQEGTVLIQAGPYALVRNPMYLGILLIGLGMVLMLFNWWVAAIFLLVFISRYVLLIFKEEKKLKILFPDDYPIYQQNVPFILPSIGMISKKDISEYLPLKLSWLKREIGSMLVVLFLTLLMESWEDIKKKGIVIYFKEATVFLIIIILFICMIIYLSRRTASLEKDVSDKSENSL